MKKLKQNFYFSAIIGSFFFILPGCEIINPDEGLPSYIHIPEISVESVPGLGEGSLSSKITHVNIFIPNPTENNTTTLGIFELPATIPILLEGDFEINIDPVIQANGSSFSLVPYPFYERLAPNRTLEVAKVDTLNLITRYKNNSQFIFIEDFDVGAAVFFTRSLELGSPNAIDATETDAFEGRSGLIELDTANAGFKIATEQFFTINRATAGAVFLEMNYKNEIQIELGLRGKSAVSGETEVIEYILREQEDWNKIYINLTDLMAFMNQDEYSVMIQGVMPVGIDGQLLIESANVWLDNIKMIHF